MTARDHIDYDDADDREESNVSESAAAEMHTRVAEAAATAPTAELAARLIRAFEMWQVARETAVKERKRCNEQLGNRIALFTEAMNVGHSNTNDQILKLSIVEQRWQDLEDAREERKQVGEACRDAIRSAEQKIKDTLAEIKGGQLGLNFQPGAAEPAAGAGVDDDAGQEQGSEGDA